MTFYIKTMMRFIIHLLLQSFYSLDDFSGLIVHEFTLSTYLELLHEANLQIILRTVTMAAMVTLACAVIAFPIAYYAARYARGWMKALFYLAVMMPLWSSYLVKIYAWKLILAKEGIVTWFASALNLSWVLDAILASPPGREEQQSAGRRFMDQRRGGTAYACRRVEKLLSEGVSGARRGSRDRLINS